MQHTLDLMDVERVGEIFHLPHLCLLVHLGAQFFDVAHAHFHFASLSAICLPGIFRRVLVVSCHGVVCPFVVDLCVAQLKFVDLAAVPEILHLRSL